jgi:hypothetical protein
MGRLGFTFIPPIDTRPFLMASTAIERVLNMRAAQRNLSNLASIKVLCIDYVLLLSGILRIL